MGVFGWKLGAVCSKASLGSSALSGRTFRMGWIRLTSKFLLLRKALEIPPSLTYFLRRR